MRWKGPWKDCINPSMRWFFFRRLGVFSRKKEKPRDETLIIHLFSPLNAMNGAWERMEREILWKVYHCLTQIFLLMTTTTRRARTFFFGRDKKLFVQAKMCFIIVWKYLFRNIKGKREFMPPECVSSDDDIEAGPGPSEGGNHESLSFSVAWKLSRDHQTENRLGESVRWPIGACSWIELAREMREVPENRNRNSALSDEPIRGMRNIFWIKHPPKRLLSVNKQRDSNSSFP